MAASKNSEEPQLDFWIDQYGPDLDRALDVATRISKGQYDDETIHLLGELGADHFTTAGLIKLFCELVMISDLKSLKRHNGDGLGLKVRTFLERLRHSNFTEDDANILASVVMNLSASDERVLRETEGVRREFTNTTFRPNLVHPKISWIARNLHPGIEEIYQKLAKAR